MGVRSPCLYITVTARSSLLSGKSWQYDLETIHENKKINTDMFLYILYDTTLINFTAELVFNRCFILLFDIHVIQSHHISGR